jgi:hypothetical protein
MPGKRWERCNLKTHGEINTQASRISQTSIMRLKHHSLEFAPDKTKKPIK